MLKWGIIGTGQVAYEIAYAIKSIKDNLIVAVSSRTPSNAEDFARNLHIEKIYSTYKQLVDDKEIEVVYIAVPNAFHAQIMKECLEGGKHVLCEKPFTLNALQAIEIQKTASNKGLFCMEAFWSRFVPSVGYIKKLLLADEIGKVQMISGSFGQVIKNKRAFDLLAGGGVLLDLGIYPIALAYTFLGKPDKVNGNLVLGKSGVDVQASINLTYETGTIVNIICSYETKLDNEFVIYGEKGVIRLSAPFYRTSVVKILKYNETISEQENSKVVPRNYFTLPGIMKNAPFMVEQVRRYLPSRFKNVLIPFTGNGYQDQILHINDCLRKGLKESPFHSLNSTINVLEIIDKVRNQEGFTYPTEHNELH